MTIQNINLDNISSASIDGVDLTEIILNGTSIWAGSSQFDYLGGAGWPYGLTVNGVTPNPDYQLASVEVLQNQYGRPINGTKVYGWYYGDTALDSGTGTLVWADTPTSTTYYKPPVTLSSWANKERAQVVDVDTGYLFTTWGSNTTIQGVTVSNLKTGNWAFQTIQWSYGGNAFGASIGSASNSGTIDSINGDVITVRMIPTSSSGDTNYMYFSTYSISTGNWLGVSKTITSSPLGTVGSSYHAPNGDYWVGSGIGIQRYSFSTNTWTNVIPNIIDGAFKVTSNKIYYVSYSGNGGDNSWSHQVFKIFDLNGNILEDSSIDNGKWRYPVPKYSPNYGNQYSNRDEGYHTYSTFDENIIIVGNLIVLPARWAHAFVYSCNNYGCSLSAIGAWHVFKDDGTFLGSAWGDPADVNAKPSVGSPPVLDINVGGQSLLYGSNMIGAQTFDISSIIDNHYIA